MGMEICQDCFCLNCPRAKLEIGIRGYCEVCSKCDSRTTKIIFSKSECSVCMWRVEYEKAISGKTASRRNLEIFQE